MGFFCASKKDFNLEKFFNNFLCLSKISFRRVCERARQVGLRPIPLCCLFFRSLQSNS